MELLIESQEGTRDSFSPSLRCSHWLWRPHTLLFDEYHVSFSKKYMGGKEKPDHFIYKVPRLQISIDVILLSHFPSCHEQGKSWI
jgi:hypothetical protein